MFSAAEWSQQLPVLLSSAVCLCFNWLFVGYYEVTVDIIVCRYRLHLASLCSKYRYGVVTCGLPCGSLTCGLPCGSLSCRLPCGSLSCGLPVGYLVSYLWVTLCLTCGLPCGSFIYLSLIILVSLICIRQQWQPPLRHFYIFVLLLEINKATSGFTAVVTLLSSLYCMV